MDGWEGQLAAYAKAGRRLPNGDVDTTVVSAAVLEYLRELQQQQQAGEPGRRAEGSAADEQLGLTLHGVAAAVDAEVEARLRGGAATELQRSTQPWHQRILRRVNLCVSYLNHIISCLVYDAVLYCRGWLYPPIEIICSMQPFVDPIALACFSLVSVRKGAIAFMRVAR